MPGTVLAAFHVLSHLMLTTTSGDGAVIIVLQMGKQKIPISP